GWVSVVSGFRGCEGRLMDETGRWRAHELHPPGGVTVHPSKVTSARLWNDVLLSVRAGDCRSTEGRTRQAALETLKRGFRQDSEYCTGTRKILQGSDTLFRKPDTACRSRVGCTPDVNQDA